MRFLITGGLGFIGSHLTKKLIAEGHEVIVIDNLSSGKISNLFPLWSPKLKIIIGDIRNLKEMQDNIIGNIDGIFHLASLVITTGSLREPYNYAETNLKGTYNIAEIAKELSVKKIVFASSGAVYGFPDELPINETAKIKPIHPYALTKYLAEQYLSNYCKMYNMEFIALRLFYVYGKNTRQNSVISKFLELRSRGLPLTIRGDGSQSNDYTYVDDVVEAFMVAMSSQKSGEIYNVGTGIPSSIKKLASYMGMEVQYIDKDDKEPDCVYADIRKIRNELFWEPKVLLEQGMRNILGE